MEKIESKFWILQVELLDLIIADAKQLPAGRAFNGRRSRLIRIQQSKLTKNLAGIEIDASFPDPESARHDKEHLIRRVAAVKQHFASRNSPGRTKRFDPAQIQIVFRRIFDLFDQPQHLAQPDDIERQQNQVKDQHRIGIKSVSIADEEEIADNARDPKRHHGFHVERHENACCGRIT
ncbi:MAG: hypothetical protein ABSG88_03195 [Bradyrhizobium sp.]